MTKTMINPVLRCRYCYAKLTKPVCEICVPTRVKIHQTLSAANQIFLARNSIFEPAVLAALKPKETEPKMDRKRERKTAKYKSIPPI